ncbi:MAG: hypothetical protein R6V54_08020, partial [Desulfobacteraceae bacterium]
IGKHCHDNILQHVDEAGIDLCQNGCPLHATINDGEKRESIVYLHHKEGHRVPVIVRVVPLKNEKDEIIGAVELFFENIKVQSLEEKINELKKENYKDELTCFLSGCSVLAGRCFSGHNPVFPGVGLAPRKAEQPLLLIL